MIKNLTKSNFVKNVALVATGTAGAQAISMLFTPILTRIYSPEAFGLLGIFISVASILFPLAALSYPMAIVLPKKNIEAVYLAKLSLFISILIACILSILLYLFSDILLKYMNAESIKSYIFLIPLTVFFTAILSIVSQWLIRNKQFKTIAKVNVYQSIVVNLFKTGLGLLNPIALYLIITTSISYLFQTVMLIKISKEVNLYRKLSILKFRNKLLYLSKKYSDFAIFRTPQNVINSFSQNLPVLLLASFFSPASAGLYTIARIVLGIPSRLLGQSVTDVFYSRVNEANHKNENITKLIIKATKGLALIGILPFGIIFIFGPQLFELVFGQEWYTAGEYAQWLSIFLYFSFINRPSVASIPTLKIQNLFLYFEIFSTTLKVISFLIGYYFFKSDITAIILFSITGAFLNCLLIIYTIYNSKGFK